MDLYLGSFNHITVKSVTRELTNRNKMTQFGEKIQQAHVSTHHDRTGETSYQVGINYNYFDKNLGISSIYDPTCRGNTMHVING